MKFMHVNLLKAVGQVIQTKFDQIIFFQLKCIKLSRFLITPKYSWCNIKCLIQILN